MEVDLEDALETSRSFYKDLKEGGNKLPAEFKVIINYLYTYYMYM